MSIFDDIPLPVGTKFRSNEIVAFNADDQKYLVRTPYGDSWESRTSVEAKHADSLTWGVATRYQSPGNGYNSRFMRTRV